MAWTFLIPAELWRVHLPSQFCILQVRGTLLTASQCATYDDIKRIWMQTTGWRDGLGTHVGVSMITGEPHLWPCWYLFSFLFLHTAQVS